MSTQSHRSLMLNAPVHYVMPQNGLFLYTTRLTYKSISYRLKTPKRSALFLPTSKNRFSHQTWKTPSAANTPIWKMLHHFTRALVLSAVFRCVRSRRTIYDCSSLTCASSSESCRTVEQALVIVPSGALATYPLLPMDQMVPQLLGRRQCHGH
jgi:hypothetical protein